MTFAICNRQSNARPPPKKWKMPRQLPKTIRRSNICRSFRNRHSKEAFRIVWYRCVIIRPFYTHRIIRCTKRKVQMLWKKHWCDKHRLQCIIIWWPLQIRMHRPIPMQNPVSKRVVRALYRPHRVKCHALTAAAIPTQARIQWPSPAIWGNSNTLAFFCLHLIFFCLSELKSYIPYDSFKQAGCSAAMCSESSENIIIQAAAKFARNDAAYTPSDDQKYSSCHPRISFAKCDCAQPEIAARFTCASEHSWGQKWWKKCVCSTEWWWWPLTENVRTKSPFVIDAL